MFKLSKDRLMRYRPLSSKLYSKNRDHFIRGLESGGLAVFNSNDIYPISADSTLPFAQHRDIFYLSGIDQEESILLLFPDAPKPEHREILFIKKTDEKIAIWEGQKLTQEQATALSGIQTVCWFMNLKNCFSYWQIRLKFFILIPTNTIGQRWKLKPGRTDLLNGQSQIPKIIPLPKSNFILQKLRSVKDAEELSIKNAIELPKKASAGFYPLSNREDGNLKLKQNSLMNL